MSKNAKSTKVTVVKGSSQQKAPEAKPQAMAASSSGAGPNPIPIFPPISWDDSVPVLLANMFCPGLGQIYAGYAHHKGALQDRIIPAVFGFLLMVVYLWTWYVGWRFFIFPGKWLYVYGSFLYHCYAIGFLLGCIQMIRSKLGDQYLTRQERHLEGNQIIHGCTDGFQWVILWFSFMIPGVGIMLNSTFAPSRAEKGLTFLWGWILFEIHWYSLTNWLWNPVAWFAPWFGVNIWFWCMTQPYWHSLAHGFGVVAITWLGTDHPQHENNASEPDCETILNIFFSKIPSGAAFICLACIPSFGPGFNMMVYASFCKTRQRRLINYVVGFLILAIRQDTEIWYFLTAWLGPLGFWELWNLPLLTFACMHAIGNCIYSAYEIVEPEQVMWIQRVPKGIAFINLFLAWCWHPGWGIMMCSFFGLGKGKITFAVGFFIYYIMWHASKWLLFNIVVYLTWWIGGLPVAIGLTCWNLTRLTAWLLSIIHSFLIWWKSYTVEE